MATRAGRSETRAIIGAAAHRLFKERGFAATPVRDVASAAGVDAALVIRYFGSKQELFVETMQLEIEHRAVLDGPIESLGERFIDYMLRAEEPTRSVYLALVRASESETVGSTLREAHESQFVRPLQERLSGPDAELRARLAAALVGGLLFSVWVVGDESLLNADHDDVVRRYGALLQQLITP